MNIRKSVLLGAAALFATVSSVIADVTINITGATAFRAAAHTSIIATLGGNGVVQYAYSTAAGAAATNLSSADRAIFVGPVAGLGTVTVRCSWSGSTAGIASVVTASPVSVPVLSTSISTAGVNGGISFENVVPKFSFSDVAQAASNNPTPALNGTQVGVVPFMFLAQEGAPLGITNMTDQLFAALYATGSAPLSTFTGSSADESKFVIPTGRNTGSGTRVTILAETGYGFTTPVNQFQPTITGSEVTAIGSASNNGYSSNSGVRAVLEVPMSASLTNSFLVVGYLTISDALQAITNGAKQLTYNGVPYSEENVKNGSYSLWGYQWLYSADGLTTDETTFLNAFIGLIPANLGTAGIPIPDMKVIRSGGDGGQISTLL
jgi:hypothetical protein